MITVQQLIKIGVNSDLAFKFELPIKLACEKGELNTDLRKCHFLAQVLHESKMLSVLSENLNYSADGLLKTFKKYFNAETADRYARKPEKIANKVYALRMGNGNELSGDGWKYRGKGPIQCTGKNNYKACGEFLGIDLINNPDLLLIPEYGMQAAAWFWSVNKLNQYADKDNILMITQKINNGVNGLNKRQELLSACKKALIVGEAVHPVA